MKNYKLLISMTIISALLAGCSSAKDASKSNFKKVLNDHYERNCITVGPWRSNFPVTVRLEKETSDSIKKQNQRTTAKYDALANVGLLQVADATTEVSNIFNRSKKITVPTKTYSLTKKGKAEFQDGKTSSAQGFCVGIYRVDEIQNFSEPADFLGKKISEMKYTVSAHKIKAWAKDPAIVAAYPHLESRLAANQKKSDALILMNDGWAHPKDAE